MRIRSCSILLALVLTPMANAQSSSDSATYALRWRTDALMLGGSLALAGTGVLVRGSQEPIPENTIGSLRTTSVNAFDRQVFDLIGDRRTALRNSDMVVGLTVAAPLLLGLDKKVREEWKPLLVMYAETMMLNTGIQNWTSHLTDRYRPITYVTDAPMNERMDNVNHNSFYSGHTSATAAASFFTASVIVDLHPELGWKRWLVYSAAVVPPAMAGYYRMQAGKHFPTDVITGAIAGAAVGTLVPAIHRNHWGTGLTVIPCFGDDFTGCSIGLRW